MDKLFQLILNRDSILYRRYTNEEFHKIDQHLIEDILSLSTKSIVKSLIKENLDQLYQLRILKSDVPQFSNFDNTNSALISILSSNPNNGYTYDDIGELLLDCDKNQTAYKKYGENHAKMGELFGLTYIDRKIFPHRVYVTNVAMHYNELDNCLKSMLLVRTILSSNLFKILFLKSFVDEVNVVEELKILSFSTMKRRVSNVRTILDFIKNNTDDLMYLIDSIK